MANPYRASADQRLPDVLICAGLDPSGGAGLIADIRVADELGCRPCGVVTALTVQNTTGVVGSHPCDPDVVGHELAFLMTDIEMRAIKIGMVGSSALARAIANALHLSAAPVVWDPVMYPTRGGEPLNADPHDDAMTALRPHLTLVTPNKQELFLMTGLPTGTSTMAEAAARALAQKLDTAVLIKGGHFAGNESIDILLHAGGREELRGPRLGRGEDVHGTGCALASAIAAHLAHGRELVEACTLAKEYVAKLIENPVHPGRGAAAVK
jgi:hydroxymethylpyrimidine kinase/phosphomethylpyrimidine kinase